MLQKRLIYRTRSLRAIASIGMLGLACLVHADSRETDDTKTVARVSSVRLEVAGELTHPLSFDAESFAKLPHRTVKAKGHDGVESQYQGVPLIEILAKAGVPTGKELRGKALGLYVVIEASDGYRAVFALAELDSEFTDRVVLLADRRDEKPLDAHAGPLQVIVPGEKKFGRWVRQVIRIKVSKA